MQRCAARSQWLIAVMAFHHDEMSGWFGEFPTLSAKPSLSVAAPRTTRPWASDDGSYDRLYRPSPEYSTPSPAPARHRARPRGWLPSLAGVLWLATGVGLCLDGFAVMLAPGHPGYGLALFWAAILLPFVTYMIVLLAAQPSSSLRRLAVSAVGVYPAVIYRMASPLVLGGFDEHIHERTLLDLLQGSGLFAPNPILPVSSHYMGMELFTGVMVRLTGMPVMLAMSLTVLLCRLLLVLTLYHCTLTVTSSDRAASLVVLLYALSPQFYFFNSQFAYQTMALTLGLGGLFLLRQSQLAHGSAVRPLFWAAVALLLATVVTHHVTSWIVLGFLVTWAVLAPAGQRKILAWAAVAMGIAVALWTADVVHQLVAYLGPVVAAALHELQALAGGAAPQREVFGGTGTAVTPEWERLILIFYALASTFAAVICGWTVLARGFRRRNRMLALMGVLTLAYPLALAAHFVPTAADLGDRSSTFLFLPFALACSLVLTTSPGVSWRIVRRPGPAVWLFLAALLAGTYMGGVMLGAGPNWEILPGHYLVSAEMRTQDPETLAATQWAASHLPAGSRIVADRVPADLLAGQGRLWPVVVPEHGLEAAQLYFADAWGPSQTAIVRGLHIHYIYVDRRIASSPPQDGFYFYPGETAKPVRITADDLSKFAQVRGLTVVYHHGPVTIYNTIGLGVTPLREGFTGQHPMGFGGLGDGLLGAMTAGIILLLRRRMTWIRSAAQDLYPLGIALSAMALTVLVGLALFESRLMPGPGFTVGAGCAALVALVILRPWRGKNVSALTLISHKPDPLICLGLLIGAVGLALSLRVAWAVDETAVSAILRSVGIGAS